MKSLRVVLALLFIVAVIAACSAKQGKEITGVWQKEDGSGTIEFTKDGKLNLAGGPSTISAPCKVDKENIQVDLGIFGTGTLKYALAKDSLTITDAKGTSAKYARVTAKPQDAQKTQPEPANAKQQAPKAQPEPAKAQNQAPAAGH